MLTKLKLPVVIPWTTKTKWDTFGETFDRVELDGPHISEELREFLYSKELKPVYCCKFTIFPDKTQTIYVDSPWCEFDNHSRIYWIEGGDVQITFYDTTEPLGLDNIENLFGIKEATDDDCFTNSKNGWIIKKETLVEIKKETVRSGEIILINEGTPHLIEAITPVRAKIYSIGFNDKDKLVNDSNGMTYQKAQSIFKQYE